MAYADRKKLISEIEAKRGSKVFTYVTGDRPTGGYGVELTFSVEPSVVPVIHEALRSFGRCEKIDLFLYTRGGAIDVVWPIVSLVREFAQKKFSIIIPFRAHSAGTLLSMGADEIVMCDAAELTSVDPTTGNVFNPPDDLSPGKRKGISVEDVTSYFAFARENDKVKLQAPEHIMETFKQLTSQIHPLALGHVQRVYTQIRMLAEKLLCSHMGGKEEKKIKEIVATLTEKLYSHTHAVNRRDAKALFGDIVTFPEEAEHGLLWSLFEDYSKSLELRKPHNLLSDLGGNQRLLKSYVRGFVETSNLSTAYTNEIDVVVASAQWQGAILNQSAQTALNNIQPSAAGMPTYVPGWPCTFAMNVLFEGWADNTKGV
jgi:hypothetical protein